MPFNRYNDLALKMVTIMCSKHEWPLYRSSQSSSIFSMHGLAHDETGSVSRSLPWQRVANSNGRRKVTQVAGFNRHAISVLINHKPDCINKHKRLFLALACARRAFYTSYGIPYSLLSFEGVGSVSTLTARKVLQRMLEKPKHTFRCRIT